MATEYELIVGTYGEFLLGYKVGYSAKDPGKLVLTLSFASQVHTASLRCVASSGKYLASGGADDRIVIHDMEKRAEVNLLMHHDGTVNTLEFSPNATHLLSGGADGTISVVRTGSWLLEKKWIHAHKNSPVTCISIHPSGKLALSIGNDLTLRTWNLVKGRQAYATNLNSKKTLGKIVECVKWSTDGNYFAVSGASVVEVYDLNSAANVKSLVCNAKPTIICWINDSSLLVGLDNGNIIMSCLDEEESTIFETKQGRIKDIKVINKFVATIASTGEVTLWELSDNSDNKHLLTSLCSTNIGCRPTCLTIIEIAKLSVVDTPKIEETTLKVEQSEEKTGILSENKINHSVGSVIVEMEQEEDNLSAEKKTKKRKSKRKSSDTEGTEGESAVEENIDKKIKMKKSKRKSSDTEGTEGESAVEENVEKKIKKKKSKRKSSDTEGTEGESAVEENELKTKTKSKKKNNFEESDNIPDNLEQIEKNIKKKKKSKKGKLNLTEPIEIQQNKSEEKRKKRKSVV